MTTGIKAFVSLQHLKDAARDSFNIYYQLYLLQNMKGTTSVKIQKAAEMMHLKGSHIITASGVKNALRFTESLERCVDRGEFLEVLREIVNQSELSGGSLKDKITAKYVSAKHIVKNTSNPHASELQDGINRSSSHTAFSFSYLLYQSLVYQGTLFFLPDTGSTYVSYMKEVGSGTANSIKNDIKWDFIELRRFINQDDESIVWLEDYLNQDIASSWSEQDKLQVIFYELSKKDPTLQAKLHKLFTPLQQDKLRVLSESLEMSGAASRQSNSARILNSRQSSNMAELQRLSTEILQYVKGLSEATASGALEYSRGYQVRHTLNHSSSQLFASGAFDPFRLKEYRMSIMPPASQVKNILIPSINLPVLSQATSAINALQGTIKEQGGHGIFNPHGASGQQRACLLLECCRKHFDNIALLHELFSGDSYDWSSDLSRSLSKDIIFQMMTESLYSYVNSLKGFLDMAPHKVASSLGSILRNQYHLGQILSKGGSLFERAKSNLRGMKQVTPLNLPNRDTIERLYRSEQSINSGGSTPRRYTHV
ncbi:hypothetical protein [Dongshaea marina]|uniref:hypothetical protein n=1 Tax=Dongshaea marina TaxID=2047966 RepID=UPI000D3E3094|nr:hypothetical protein [Dongshaea marina]